VPQSTATSLYDLSIADAAKERGCSTDTIRRMVSRGDLKAYRLGPRLIRIRRRDLERAMRPVTPVDLVTTDSAAPEAVTQDAV